MRCHPPRLSQLLIRLRAIKTDEVVVKTIAEETHGATPRWLHVVSDRSMLDPCGVMAIEYESQNMSHSALEAALSQSGHVSCSQIIEISWRVSCTRGSQESALPPAAPAVTVRADTTFESAERPAECPQTISNGAAGQVAEGDLAVRDGDATEPDAAVAQMSLAEQDSETSLSSPSRQTTSTAQLLTETQSEEAECTAAFSTEPESTAAATDVYMRFEWGDMSGESVIDGHRESVQLRVHSIANLWVRLSGARLLNQIVRLRVIQGGLVGPARENTTYNEAGISTGFERGTLNSLQITIMKLRTTPIRVVIRVRCSCPFNSLRVITVNTKTLAALSHVVSSCLAPNQLQFHDHIVIVHGAERTGITLSIKYQGNYKSHHSSSPKSEHPFERNGLLRLLAHCEPLFAQPKSVNKCYLRLKHVLLVIQNRAGGYRYGALITHIRAGSGHVVAEIAFKGDHFIRRN